MLIHVTASKAVSFDFFLPLLFVAKADSPSYFFIWLLSASFDVLLVELPLVAFLFLPLVVVVVVLQLGALSSLCVAIGVKLQFLWLSALNLRTTLASSRKGTSSLSLSPSFLVSVESPDDNDGPSSVFSALKFVS